MQEWTNDNKILLPFERIDRLLYCGTKAIQGISLVVTRKIPSPHAYAKVANRPNLPLQEAKFPY